ncbi:uncharacterized protein LOC112347527 [Selaginella moellendorffii]|uniref:uncharacterized protein LOC112347522 n=1 Tax=Selaginella moellendorffii TaxID=88036 RepID=UPI000D1C9B92|nr:uncharacterized protein LOC112347522 [Selaginella moellendorffii]XP_024534328.1 uncharacterized protein LOC112347527 [Selaginella moellendorffii]|eukprot:XP_024534323.1 uncharacterized protein LOC112347522 [Selaginella moellendorffii]
MANRFLVFLGHGIPAIAFIFWGLLLLLTNAASRFRGHEKPGRLSLITKPAEFYILFLGSAGVITFHCILQPTRSYPDLEHISMAIPFMIYALCLRSKLHLPSAFVSLMEAAAFAQELFLFHWHSTDHVGVEGHYHMLLQLIVTACMFSSLVEVFVPQNHNAMMIKFWKSICIIFHGIWLLQLSLLLVFPATFLPLGCQVFVRHHQKIECGSENLVNQSKAMGTLLFSWYLSLLMVGSAISYAVIERKTLYNISIWNEQDEELP